MKNEEEIKKAMENIKNQLPDSQGNETIMLQGQFSALRWVVTEVKEEKEDDG